ncbi:DUF4252 domain-containing protein [Flavobacteriaceae bacterium TP-CH-4]|uniref:DUF4252 domain-containing protein n=1 Tax=Pelagihabitans pacificus TaxID=2696054 RepID=A0A967E5E9_9FLAO|nr:DUF4252 domain-containing protein [Pelagihabitans pacificus]NHF59372.1 DUF4252 domain-containing protein [Pelagihabitans pacificus]
MRTVVSILSLAFLVLFGACSSTQSLQEYYVDSTENPNFLSLDLPVSLLNLEEADLTTEERAALESLRKLNVLAFKKNGSNDAEYKAEKTKVKAILKDEKFNELMRMNTQYGRATIKYLGDDDAVDEVVIYGDSDDKGFLLVRVLGNDMNPAHLAQFIKAVQKSDYKGEGLGELGEFIRG